MSFRSFLYALAKAMGDYNAVKRAADQGSLKPIQQRLARRAAGRLTGRLLGMLFR